jgi:membrane protease YdiL (CAAX protease family)
MEATMEKQKDEIMLLCCLLITMLNMAAAQLLGATTSVIMWSSLYFLAPALIILGVSDGNGIPDRFDAVTLAWMVAVPILLGKRFGGTVDLPYIAFAAAAEGLVIWKYRRGMTGITFLKQPRWSDLAWALGTLLALCSLLLALALLLGFPQQQPALARDHSFRNLLSVVWHGISSPRFLKALGLKMAITAFIEELAYRGILLNLLEKRFGPRAALVSSSLLFGLSHIGHGGWRYAALSALAGIGFGNVYQKTRNLTWSMGVHGWLDTIARLLFRF